MAVSPMIDTATTTTTKKKKKGIHHIIFCGNNLTKNFKELSLIESLFNIKKDYTI